MTGCKLERCHRLFVMTPGHCYNAYTGPLIVLMWSVVMTIHEGDPSLVAGGRSVDPLPDSAGSRPDAGSDAEERTGEDSSRGTEYPWGVENPGVVED